MLLFEKYGYDKCIIFSSKQIWVLYTKNILVFIRELNEKIESNLLGEGCQKIASNSGLYDILVQAGTSIDYKIVYFIINDTR